LELVRKIEEANIGFEIDENQIIFQKGNKLISESFSGDSIDIVANLDKDFYGINKTEKGLILVSNKGYQIVNSDKRTNGFIEVNGGIGDYKTTDSNFLVVSEKTDDSRRQSIIDPFANDTIWSTKNKERIIYSNGNYYVVNNQTISKRQAFSGDEVWKFKFNVEGFQPTNIIANSEFCLIGLLNRDLLICVNNNSGTEKWRKPSIPKAITIDTYKNVAHQLMINYSCIDLETGEILKSRVDRNYFNKVKIENQKNNVLQFENYFIANDGRSKRTGALNLNSLEFECWIDNVSIPEGYKMQASDDMLFLQGIDKTINLVKMNAR